MSPYRHFSIYCRLFPPGASSNSLRNLLESTLVALTFVSHFFCSLGTAIDMRLHFTSSYHPEVNSQAEQTNQMLEQYLCVYYNYQQNN